MDVHLCNTPASAAAAIASIAPQPIIYLDCEGSDLGSVDGTISLLSIGIPSPNPTDDNQPISPRVYLFDTLALPPPSLSPLLALLASPHTLKLVWDGRQDFSELFHRFGTALANVIDLQLVDIHSRSVRKETDTDRLRRISLKCHPMWQVSLLETDGIHGLVGLKRAPREHMVYTADLEDEVEISHDKWMDRPLQPEQLHYAAKDIVLLARLHAHFLTSNYMSPTSLPLLTRQSQRYISLHRRARPEKRKNVFVSSAFCPLEILDGDDVEMLHVKAKEHNVGLGRGTLCKMCKRELELARSFPSSGGGELDEAYRGVCKLCMFLMIRQPLLEQSKKPDASTQRGDK